MNVFEDLVEELKEENLLEETITDAILAEERKKDEPVVQDFKPVVQERKVSEEIVTDIFAEPVKPKLPTTDLPRVEDFSINNFAVPETGNLPILSDEYVIESATVYKNQTEDFSVGDLYKTSKLSENDLPSAEDLASLAASQTQYEPPKNEENFSIPQPPTNDFSGQSAQPESFAETIQENNSFAAESLPTAQINFPSEPTVENFSPSPEFQKPIVETAVPQTDLNENVESGFAMTQMPEFGINNTEEFSGTIAFDFESPAPKMEFFRQRAMNEVTSLQLVEHVFSGVEREQMKVMPKPYDDISVKKALHDFMQLSDEKSENEKAQSEFRLMQETEGWCSALSLRDKKISVNDLRRYCETTRPVLSPQALQAVAGFYRNLPHTDAIRAKFDMVMTRLFSVEDDRNRREMQFDHDALVEKISALYADWASIPIYSDSDETQLLLINLKFNDFMSEAQSAPTLDELVKTDFFGRLRTFKEETGDKFYAPQVLATAIECNISVGNRFVDLLSKERETATPETIQVKYGLMLDKTVSDAAGRTLQISELLIEKPKPNAKKLNEPKEKLDLTKGSSRTRTRTSQAGSAVRKKSFSGILGISNWILALLIGTILLTAGLYVYVEVGNEKVIDKDVQVVNLENSSYKEYIESAKISQDILIGITSEAWGNLNEEKKQEILGKLLNIGKDKGYNQVQLLNKEGISVGYANEKEIVGSIKPKS